jgi:putative transposase
MGRSRYKVLSTDFQPYFLTCSTINWIVLFNKPEIVNILLDSLRFLIANNRLVLHGWVIMENHLHLLASSLQLSKEIGHFKSFTARTIIDYLEKHQYRKILSWLEFFKKQHKKEQKYQLWQEGSHPEEIISQEMLITKLNYIHYNPVRSGYVDQPSHWRYSSYHDYYGEKGLLPIEIIGL